jgi:hypothetical protein
VVRIIDALVVADVVEDEELRFRPEVGRIANAALFEMGFGFLGYVSGITAVRLSWIS